MSETTPATTALGVDTLVPGDLITVTLTDGAAHQQFHGAVGVHYCAATIVNARGGFNHVRREGATSRDWITVFPQVSKGFTPTVGLPYASKDWQFGVVSLGVCLDSEQVRVESLTDEGRQWLRGNASDSDKRDRLIARFAEFDGPAAEELDELISTMLVEAREDGRVEQREVGGY